MSPRFATFALVSLALSGGCRTRAASESAAPPGAVGFELPGAGPVARGAILTKPPGREEAFLAFVAGGAPGWAGGCRAEAGGPSPSFSFETGSQGTTLGASPVAGETARERCLAMRAVATAVSTPLPPGTRVTVQLALR
jgi:hypothetical protein